MPDQRPPAHLAERYGTPPVPPGERHGAPPPKPTAATLTAERYRHTHADLLTERFGPLAALIAERDQTPRPAPQPTTPHPSTVDDDLSVARRRRILHQAMWAERTPAAHAA
jgi:hypothetical protein